MRQVMQLLLGVSLLTSLISAYKIPLIRKSHHRQFSSARHSRRTIDSNLLFSDSAIIAPISIGTPPQHVYVLLDTSSSDMALFSPEYISQYKPTTSASSSSLGTAYDSSSSSSYQSSTEVFQNNYGSGLTSSSFIASMGKETVSIQGLELINQPFGLIQSGNVSYGPMASGILGLAFEAISTGMRAVPPIQQLFLDGALPAPLFTFALQRPSSQSELSTQSSITQPGGIFTLGHLDNDQYQGKIGWSNLVTSGTQQTVPTKWLVALDNITVNGVLIDGSHGLIANFDTGSSASRASQSILSSIFVKADGALMSSEGDYYLPCGDGVTPSMNMTISMGGVSVAIEPLDLLYKTQAYSNNDETFCSSTLTSTTSDQYDLQIGDDILRSLFVAFQYDPPRIGLAAQSTNVHNEAAAASFIFKSDQTIAIDSPTSPSQPASLSHVSVQTVTGRATSYIPIITESGEAYTFQQGGQFVSAATEKEHTIVASSTPVPLGPVDGTSTTNSNGISDSEYPSSASQRTPKYMLALSFAISAGLILSHA